MPLTLTTLQNGNSNLFLGENLGIENDCTCPLKDKFIASLLTTKPWKQLKRPSTGEWINCGV